MGFFEFIKDLSNLSYLFLFLPVLTYYLANRTGFLIFSLIIVALLLVYKLDLKNKEKLVIAGRIKTKRRNKSLLRNWRSMISDANNEFGAYMFNWWFFGAVYLAFMGSYAYSAIISFGYSKILFGIHIAVAVFFVFLAVVANSNLNKKAKIKKNGKKS